MELKVPVTALHIAKNHLLSGVGSFLLVYEISEQNKHEVVFSTKVFDHHVVHGIKEYYAEPRRFYIIFGGRELCICELHRGKKIELRIIFTLKVHEWIWDVAPIFESGDANNEIMPDSVALALGHNTVLLYNWRKKTIITETHCEEKCILYSAHFVLNKKPTWNSLVVCSGTVFNQVVIWKPSDAKKSKANVIKRIQAHEGVIFDMHHHSNSGYLVTASDDRSIRIWGCNFLKQLSENCKIDDAPANYLCKLYGHESRVWRARFVACDERLYLISIGEDGYCIIWKISSTQSTESVDTVEGKIVRKIKCHKGRNIWSLAIDESGCSIATGGGDGGIRIWKLHELVNEETKITRHPFICAGKTPHISQKVSDLGFLKSVQLCDTGCVLGHTDAGILLRFDIQTSSWSVVNENANFRSYAVMRVCDEFKLVAIGNTKGEMSLLLFENDWSSVISKTTTKADSTSGKIHNITWFLETSTPFVFVSGSGGELLCFEISISEDNSEISSVKMFSWTIPISKHRWHMGAVMVKHEKMVYVVCGDRRGSLHLFKQDIKDPLHTLHGIHGKNGVTSVKQIGKMLISTGRDGVWKKLKVDFERESMLVMTQNRAAQGMDWLETVTKTQHSTNSLMILGFHGRNYTAWSSATGDTLLSIECGGGHRDWSFKVLDGNSTLAFVKESVLHLAKISRDITKETSVVEPSFHGGQITCVKHIDSYYDQISESVVSFLLTGSEDTRVLISASVTRHTGDNKLHHIHTLDDHVSSVRTISMVKIEENDRLTKILLFSGGGRASINGYVVTLMKNVCWEESCTVEHVFSHSLNTNSNVKRKSLTNVNPETRYMDSTAWKEGGKIFLAAACSDGFIRLFYANLESRSLTLWCQSSSYNHCFLTIRHFIINNIIHLITGATDGFIRIWNMHGIVVLPQSPFDKSDDAPQTGNNCVIKVMPHLKTSDVTPQMPPACFNTEVHMSGINALDLWEGFDNLILLATGGDDNAIHLNLLSIENNVVKVIANLSIKSAHSTQITGLSFVSDEVTDSIKLFSTSIDQRVTKWDIAIDKDNNINCEFVTSVLTNVADVSSLATWTGCNNTDVCRRRICVCGQGIQIFDGGVM